MCPVLGRGRSSAPQYLAGRGASRRCGRLQGVLRHAKRQPFPVYLYDIVSGEPLALIDANFFSVVRTGRCGGAATRHLARTDAGIVGQIGAGRMGAGQLEAVCAVRAIRKAQVYSRTREKLEEFCRTMTARLNLEVVPAASAQSAVLERARTLGLGRASEI